MRSGIEESRPIPDVDILLPIHTEHAESLYSGTKEFELRKTLPKSIPRRVFLYEVNHVSAVSGHIVLSRVLSASPRTLWRTVGRRATNRDRFFRYFGNRPTANAFEVRYAVQYSKPIDLSEIKSIQEGFRQPQGFVYLNSFPNLQSHLISRAVSEVGSALSGGFRFEILQVQHEELFRELVTPHVSRLYADTGIDYTQYLIDHGRGIPDAQGIFTITKFVLEIHLDERLVGFTVLTFKVGGCCKSGPTVIVPNRRNQGVGTRMRDELHAFARKLGLRKVYCTTSTDPDPRVSYLVRAGYRVEAHLSKQYHSAHDEFVFGKLLVQPEPMQRQRQAGTNSVDRIERVELYSDRAVRFLRKEIGILGYCVPEEWAERQVRLAAAFAKGRAQSEKPRVIIVGLRERSVECGVVCLPKRGGACKLLVLPGRATRESIVRVLRRTIYRIARFRMLSPAKVYTLVPLDHGFLIDPLCSLGFIAEGILRRPVSDYCDALVLSLPIQRDRA